MCVPEHMLYYVSSGVRVFLILHPPRPLLVPGKGHWHLCPTDWLSVL